MNDASGQAPDQDENLRIAAETLGLDLSLAQRATLHDFVRLLQRWNATYNLTSVRDPAEMLTHHLFDCLAIVTPLRKVVHDGPCRILDVGSGGGLPGVVIAALFPQAQVVCVDAVGKKTSFIRQAAIELQLSNLGAENARVEQLSVGAFDVITARAFSSLHDLVGLSRHALRPEGCWLAMKGRVPLDEIDQVPPDIEVFHVEPLSVPSLVAERCIVWMRVASSSSE